MTEQLKGYIEEWNEMHTTPTSACFDFDRFDKELKSLQTAIRICYENEKDFLTEEEKKAVEKILSVDLTDFG